LDAQAAVNADGSDGFVRWESERRKEMMKKQKKKNEYEYGFVLRFVTWHVHADGTHVMARHNTIVESDALS
jgi:hypothetical protein